MATPERVCVAIIGSGNIGTDLMINVLRTSRTLQMAAIVGVDAQPEGMARAKRFAAAATSISCEPAMPLLQRLPPVATNPM